MNTFKSIKLPVVLLSVQLLVAVSAEAGPAGTAMREVGEFILKKFGKGAAGQTVDEIAEAAAKVVAKHGDGALPLLRNSGHAGFTALKEAGENAPDVIKLYARRGDEAIWVISEPKKLAIFIKHGDSAADALLKHPGIADSLIGRYGDEAVGALNTVSRRSAQRLNMIAEDGLLTATPRSRELLGVIRKHGDEAMDFIWKNRKALAVAAILATFLNNPEAYFSGANQLLASPMANINWTLLLGAVLLVLFLPTVARSIKKAILAMNFPNPNR